MVKLLSGNVNLQDKVCEELGFAPAGKIISKDGRFFSVAKIAINKMP